MLTLVPNHQHNGGNAFGNMDEPLTPTVRYYKGMTEKQVKHVCVCVYAP